MILVDTETYDEESWSGFPLDIDTELSRYITIAKTLHTGLRKVYVGKYDKYVHRFDENTGDFVSLAKSLVPLDIGTEISPDELTEWCNSDAGRAVLQPYFPNHDGPSSEAIDR